MTDSSKKRKRSSEGAVRQNKKVAFRAPTPVDSISVSVIEGTDKWAPIAALTPGFAIPSSIELQPYIKRRNDATLTLPRERNSSIAAKEMLVQSSSHPTMDYLGREEAVGNADRLLKHYLGIYDPATGKLQVMEARKMVVRGVVRSHKALTEALAERGSSSNLMQLRNNLGQTFGTKKAKKAIASLTENAISSNKTTRGASPGGSQRSKPDPVAALMLESMAEAVGNVATREQLSAAIDEAKPRPMANVAAENVKDVYTAESLIGKDILKLIPVKEWQDAIKAKKEIITKSKFVARRLQAIGPDLQRLKILRYLLCLIEFHASTKSRARGERVIPPKDGLRLALPGVPEPVVEHLRRRFSVAGGQVPRFQADLLLTHACACALLVDNFEVDVFDLREDLRLEPKAVQQYFREVGAKVTPLGEVERVRLGLDKAAAAQHKMARLRLPLEFPKVKYARKK